MARQHLAACDALSCLHYGEFSRVAPCGGDRIILVGVTALAWTASILGQSR